jgi:hypothetical protein
MESYVIRPMTWPVLRLFSRNPLVRTSDRIDVAVVTLAVLVIVIAAACAGVVGTMVYDARAQTYVEQAQTRHPATAIAVEDSKTPVMSETTGSTVYARWQANGSDHADVFGCDAGVKADDPLQVWVDGLGNRVDPPTSIACAGTDAVSVAVVAWLSVVLAVTGLVIAVRARTNRARDIQWERDIRCLVGDDGGRTNSSQ